MRDHFVPPNFLLFKESILVSTETKLNIFSLQALFLFAITCPHSCLFIWEQLALMCCYLSSTLQHPKKLIETTL